MKQIIRHKIRQTLYQPEWHRIAALADAHLGARAFVVGNGPSIGHMDLSPLGREYVAVVNSGIRSVGTVLPKADMHVCLDNHGYRRYCRDFEDHALRASIDFRFYSWSVRKYWHSLPMKSNRPYFLLTNPAQFVDNVYNGHFANGIATGDTVVFSVCQILCFMGFRHIYLIGIDLDYGRSNNPYFYKLSESDRAHESEKTVRDRRKNMASNVNHQMSILADALAPYGAKIYNASLGGLLESLPRTKFDDVVHRDY